MPLSALGTATGGAATVLQSDGAGVGIILLVVYLLMLAVFGLAPLAGMWKTFEKAGRPGWAAIIPIYNLYIALDIAEKPAWWIIVAFFFAPALIIPFIDLVDKYGKGAGYAVGLYFIPFVFWPLLGFGDAEYQGARV